jgi:hypothetical protein
MNYEGWLIGGVFVLIALHLVLALIIAGGGQ